MSDDLVKRLRDTANSGGYDIYGLHCGLELEAADRIEQLQTLLKRLNGCFQVSAPLFGAQWCRSVHISDALIEDVRAALGEKKDD